MAEETQAPTGTAVAAPKPARKLDLQAIGATRTGGGAMFLPSTMQECVDFASIMSRSDFAIPPKFRNNPGACLAITIQASRWQADPFGVIQKAYVVKAQDGSERIAYEAQLVAAVVNTRANLAGRLELIYSGDGASRKLKVIGTFADTGEKREIETPTVAKAKKKSPLWDADPDQQLAYYGMRAWGRRWVPEVLLGIYTPDEMMEADLVDAPRPGRPAGQPEPAAITEGIVRAAEPEPVIEASESIDDMIPARDPGPQVVAESDTPITQEDAVVVDQVRVPAGDGETRAAAAHGISGAGLDVPPKDEVVFGTTPRSTRLSQEAGDPRDEPPPHGQDEVVDSAEFKTWEKYLHDSVRTLEAGELKTEADYDEFATLVKNAFKSAPITDDEKDDLRARFVSKLLQRKRDLFGKGRR